MKEKTRWKEIASVYIGTVIGAGFASGQELLQFFVNYGYKGILGAIVATILFMTLASLVLVKVYKSKLNSYEDLIKPILGERLTYLADFAILSYLFIGACVMVAGSGALFKEQLGIPYDVGLILMALLTLATVIHSMEGILKVNSLLIPILLVGIVSIGVIAMVKKGFVFNQINLGARDSLSWLKYAIMYVSYNIISAIVVLASLGSAIENRKTAMKAGLMGGLGLGILSIFIILAMLVLYNDIKHLEIPMLGVARFVNKNTSIPYSILIWIAMFTTAVSNSFGFLTRICGIININFKCVATVFCLITIPVAKMGFSKLVNIFYPLFGYLSLFLICLFILISTYINLKKRVFKLKR